MLQNGHRQQNLVALKNISLEQLSTTKNTSKKVAKLLNYLATNPNASIQYHVSGMIIYVHSDSYYLSTTKARIRAGVIHFLSDTKPKYIFSKTFVTLMKGIIHAICKILRNVMTLVAVVELGSLFVNAQYTAPIMTTLFGMNHLQPTTLIQVENSTAVGISNKAIKQRTSKAMDMRLY